MKILASYPPPADTSTPLLDTWVAIIVVLLVLLMGVCAIAYRVLDQQKRWDNGDEPEPEAAEQQLVDEIEQWRRQR